MSALGWCPLPATTDNSPEAQVLLVSVFADENLNTRSGTDMIQVWQLDVEADG